MRQKMEVKVRQRCVTALMAGAMLIGHMAFAEAEQSGSPAIMTTANGKTVPVFLQKLVDGKLTFQIRKKTKDIEVPADKVTHLKFLTKAYDEAAVAELQSNADFSGLVSNLSFMDALGSYMIIDNNLQDAYASLMNAYAKTGDQAAVTRCAENLLEATREELVLQAQVFLTKQAITAKDYDQADTLCEDIESDAAKLYINALINQSKEQYKAAWTNVLDVIANHANDVQWMGPTEYLAAELYLNEGMTNEAVSAASQVANMYAGSAAAVDALQFAEQYKESK